MKLARFDNLLAIESADGQVVGFHAHNLQVAQIDQPAFETIQTLARPDGQPFDQEIADELQSWNSELDPRATDSRLTNEVRSLTINIAQVCNLSCTYCAAGGDGTYGDPMKEIDLSTIYDQLRMLLSQVKTGEIFRIIFLGGEPLVAPDAIRLIHRFATLQTAGRGVGVRYDIVTNATLVSPEIAELLASMACNVTVSLDGPPEINDINRPTRGGLGSSQRTLRGIEHLRAVHDRLSSLNAAAVFGKHHLGVLATYRYLQPLGFDAIKFDFAAADGDAEDSARYTTELGLTADLAWSLGGEAELRRISLFNTYFYLLDQQTRMQNHCGAGKSHLQVDTRGKFYVCQWFVGDQTEVVGQSSQLDAGKLAEYADPLIEMHGCGSCWARHLCGGGCMFVNKIKTGSKHTKDITYCTRTRHNIAKGIEYYARSRKQEPEGSGYETH